METLGNVLETVGDAIKIHPGSVYREKRQQMQVCLSGNVK